LQSGARQRHDDQSTTLLAAIVDSASEAIIGISLDGIITAWNAAAERLYGYIPFEAIGQPITMLMPQGAVDEGTRALHHLRDMAHIDRFEAVRVRKSGQPVHVSLTMSPILDDQGAVAGAAVIARDMTKQKKDEELRQVRSNMEATTLLAGGVAHDLNNLMMAVMGHAELLTYEMKDHPGALDSLDIILTSAQMAGRLAHELLAYARGGRYQSAVINLNDLVPAVLGMQAHSLPTGCCFRQDLAQDLKNVEADPTQINQVLLNMIINAMEAIGPRGEITVATRNMDVSGDFVDRNPGMKPGSYAVLSVTDDGCGMSEDVLSQVFKPFFSTKATGRGLGMAAAYGIVKNHGGYISAGSEEGKGTCIMVYLPAVWREVLRTSDGKNPGVDGHETILVVDDEAQILLINRRILEASGYHVLTARDGAEAIKVAKEFSGDIHLVVLDMAMPVMDGAKAFSLLKQVRPACKVIISSGYGLNDVARTLLAAGADAVLQKPFRIADLTSEVRRILDSKQ
jgi:PAS domain S-box-containing protein